MNHSLERANLAARIAETLQQHGYVTQADGVYRLNISDAAGYLGTLKLSGIHAHNDTLVGSITFDPVVYSSNKGNYNLTNGDINMPGLLRRLAAEIPKAYAFRAKQAAIKIRDASDAALLQSLGPVADPDNVDVTVYNGLVDIHLTDITPEAARRVLDALGSVR